MAADHTLLPLLPCTRVLLLAKHAQHKHVEDLLTKADVLKVIGLLPYFSKDTCSAMADEVVSFSPIQLKCHL